MRDSNKSFVHTIDWERDIVYYSEIIENAGFDEIGAINAMTMDLSENTSLSYLFTGYLQDPIAGANVFVFYEILMDILEKRSRHPNGLLRGDMIHLNFLCEHPQDGWFFWDGYDIIMGSPNDNGSYRIPDTFKIFEDFPPNYFEKFPHEKLGQENVVITKYLLRQTDIRVYLQKHSLFNVNFQDEKYIVCMDKEFSNCIMDDSDVKEYIVQHGEIPNEAVDFLRGQGLTSDIIYDKTIAIRQINEDEISQLLEEMDI